VDNDKLEVREAGRAWKERWIEVERIQTSEWMKKSPDERFRELLDLWDFAKAIGKLPHEDADQPRERWTFPEKGLPH